jgi:hypothetical protein
VTDYLRADGPFEGKVIILSPIQSSRERYCLQLESCIVPLYLEFMSTNQLSQVRLLITNNSFCIVQRETAQSRTRIFRVCGVAEAPPGFQAGWSDCMYFFFLLNVEGAN